MKKPVTKQDIKFAGSEIKRFKAGDQVYRLTGLSLGAYAD
jgi:NADPH:quinone reductase-like Zn-dependent oxidoreductase